MTATLLLMVAAAVMAAGAALWFNHRRRPSPTSTPGAPPASLDRRDFRAPNAAVLIAVFTSKTCASCDAVWRELADYESSTVVVDGIEVNERADLHRRYGIESVPTVVIVDRTGATQAAFVGPLGPDHREVLRSIVAGNA